MMNEEIVTKFFTERFGRTPKSNPGYYSQWVTRFRRGEPERWMDDESKEVYQRVLNEA